jgi:hypothetical protein
MKRHTMFYKLYLSLRCAVEPTVDSRKVPDPNTKSKRHKPLTDRADNRGWALRKSGQTKIRSDAVLQSALEQCYGLMVVVATAAALSFSGS